MKNELEQIKKFRQKFRLGINSTIVDYDLHKTLIKEELYELIEAVEEKDVANIHKELVDVMFVVGGLLIDLGKENPLDAMFEATMKNNMSKLNEFGEPEYRDDGKLLKPLGFTKLDYKKVFDENQND